MLNSLARIVTVIARWLWRQRRGVAFTVTGVIVGATTHIKIDIAGTFLGLALIGGWLAIVAALVIILRRGDLS